MLDRTHESIYSDAATGNLADRPEIEMDMDEDVEDELLRLILIACHPVLSKEARVALTLRLVGGLTTDEIARAFLVPETTIAQRIEAAIAACHAQARTADETDWRRIVALYDALVQITQSPLVELNRAVAVGMAFGPAAALEQTRACGRSPKGVRARSSHGTECARAEVASGACAGVCWRDRR